MRPFVFLLLLLCAGARAGEPAEDAVEPAEISAEPAVVAPASEIPSESPSVDQRVETPGLALQQGFMLSVGSFFASPARYSLRNSSDTSFFGRAYAPEIGVGYLFPQWSIALHVSAIGRSTGDGDMRERTLRLHAPYRFSLGEHWEGKAGFGLLAVFLHGSSSEVELSNGVGTQTFYVPGRFRSTELFYLTGGGAYTAGAFRLDADFLFTSLLNRRRGLHFALGAGYVF